VLVEGAVLLEGPTTDVRKDPRVRNVYLGKRAHTTETLSLGSVETQRQGTRPNVVMPGLFAIERGASNSADQTVAELSQPSEAVVTAATDGIERFIHKLKAAQ
jgi:hypothetical protein